jgi:hypothetical protein
MILDCTPIPREDRGHGVKISKIQGIVLWIVGYFPESLRSLKQNFCAERVSGDLDRWI